jgi:hypothetical protein
MIYTTGIPLFVGYTTIVGLLQIQFLEQGIHHHSPPNFEGWIEHFDIFWPIKKLSHTQRTKLATRSALFKCGDPNPVVFHPLWSHVKVIIVENIMFRNDHVVVGRNSTQLPRKWVPLNPEDFKMGPFPGPDISIVGCIMFYPMLYPFLVVICCHIPWIMCPFHSHHIRFYPLCLH